MTVLKVDLLRLVLPPSHADKSVPVQCGWRLPDGSWHSGQSENIVEIAARFQAKRVEVCPHPVDVSMIEADLPPLPARKLRSAVHGAVELLALASPVNLAIGFGPRNADGKVPIAWMADAQVVGRLEELAHHGLRADAVLPPPAFLPTPDSSDQDDVVSATIIDDWIVVRWGANSGALFPVPACSSDAAKLDSRVQAFVPDATRIQWHRADMAAVRVEEHQLAHAGPRHAGADLAPEADQRLGRQRERAGEIGVLGAQPDVLAGQEERRQVGRQERQRRGHDAVDQHRIDAQRQVRPVLLGRPQRQHRDGGGRVERREVAGRQLRPEAARCGRGGRDVRRRHARDLRTCPPLRHTGLRCAAMARTRMFTTALQSPLLPANVPESHVSQRL